MKDIERKAGLLAECLEDLNGSLVELTAVFRVKRQILARGDVEALCEVLQREEKVAAGLFDAETRREVLTEEIAAAAGRENMKLADVADILPADAAEVLLDAGLRLRQTMSELVREARIVADICRAAVEHYDRLIRIIAGAELGGAVYTAKGAGGARAPRRNIIDQAL